MSAYELRLAGLALFVAVLVFISRRTGSAVTDFALTVLAVLVLVFTLEAIVRGDRDRP